MHRAFKEIRAIHARTTAGAKEGLAFRYVSRPLASVLLYLLRGVPVTPNQVTWLSLLVALAGILASTLWLTSAALLVAALCFVFAHILDALDGQLARERNQMSPLGARLDYFVDELKAFAVLTGLGLRQTLLATGASPTSSDPPFTDPLWLSRPLSELGLSPLALTALGLLGLGLGLSCTRMLRSPEFRAAASPAAPADSTIAPLATDGAATPASDPPRTTPSRRRTGLTSHLDAAGRFLIDYPSWLPLLLLLNRVDLYLLLYPAALLLYALRAVSQVSLTTLRQH